MAEVLAAAVKGRMSTIISGGTGSGKTTMLNALSAFISEKERLLTIEDADRLAAQGLRYTGFHTTAMCSTTRAALLTGRNHHSVGVGCLANFDSGFPGYRGKIAKEAGTLAEILRPHAYRNYMVGKWHVTP